VSLSLSAAVILFLWVHSLWQPDYIAFFKYYRQPFGSGFGQDPQEYSIGTEGYGLLAVDGRIGLVYHFTEDNGSVNPSDIPRLPLGIHWYHHDNPLDCCDWSVVSLNAMHQRHSLGFAIIDDEEGATLEYDHLKGFLIDTWILVPIPLALLCFLLWTNWLRRGCLRRQLCPTCRYDIRIQLAGSGSPICPECGTAIERASNE
jgi:hypothetical protein